MIQLTMTPDQFAKARGVILSSADVLSHSETSPTTGSFATSQVAMQYSYDGASVLTLDTTAKHGLARFASDDTIKARLVALLAKV